jgi:hypothetical protein
MHPVDEFARLKAEIRELETKAAVLRDGFLNPATPRRSNRFEVVVKIQTRRTFKKDLLPPEILTDPRFWEENRSEMVTVREIAPEAEFEVVERF